MGGLLDRVPQEREVHRRAILVLAVLLALVGAAGLVTARIRMAAAAARMQRPADYGPDEIWDPIPRSMAPWPEVAQVSTILLVVGPTCAIAIVVGAVIVGRRRTRRREAEDRRSGRSLGS